MVDAPEPSASPNERFLAGTVPRGADERGRFANSIIGSACTHIGGLLFAVFLIDNVQVTPPPTATVDEKKSTIVWLLTSYPMAVAMMSPFSAHRYVLPWRPIESVTAEALWVAVPVLLVLAGALWLRRVRIFSFTRERPISFSLH